MATVIIQFTDNNDEDAWVKEYIDSESPIGTTNNEDWAQEFDDVTDASLIEEIIGRIVNEEIGSNPNGVPPRG